MNLAIFQQFGVAILLASLIGMDRQRQLEKNQTSEFGGLRTFALIGLIGALTQYFVSFSVMVSVALISSFVLLLVGSYIVGALKSRRVGLTSEVAAVIVFVVGYLCGMESYLLATAITIVLFLILHFRSDLHSWAMRLRNVELISTIQFAIIAFVVLPLLPNAGFGPYGVFNPYVIWLMVVFISGISFLSYVAIKILGEKRGLGVTGFLAGLISSTALTLSFSGQSKKQKSIVNPYAFAVVLASSAMFFRILAEVAVLNQELFAEVLIPLVVAGMVGLFGALWLWFGKEDLDKSSDKLKKNVLEMKSPFQFKPALQFGLFFAAVLLVSRLALEFLGDAGVYAASVISALLDVDAITVSMSNLAGNGGLSSATASIAIFLAAFTNTLFKIAVFFVFGNRKVAIKILTVFVVALSAGALVAFLF